MEAGLTYLLLEVATRTLKDVCCFLVFARRLMQAMGPCRRRRLAVTLLVAALAQAAFSAIFGRDGMVDMFIVARGAVQVCFEVALYLAVGVVGLRLSPKAALTWSMVFVAGIQAGEKTFVFVMRSPLAGVMGSSPAAQDLLQFAVIAALNLAASAALAPTPRETDEGAIGALGVTLLVFVMCDCVLLMLGEDAGGPLATWHLVTNAAQCVALFLCAYMVKRSVGRSARIADMERASALARERYARLMQRREADEQIGRIYHDLRHVLSTFHSLDETDAIVARLDEARAKRGEVAYTGNVVLNMLLNDAARTARDDGVRLEVQTNLGPEPFMDDMGLCLVLGNALSNAFEAVRSEAGQRPEGSPRPEGAWVSFCATELPAAVVMKVENPCREAPPMLDGLPLTTKADASRHGIGLRSMRDVLGQCGGTLGVECRDGVFSLAMMVPRPARGTVPRVTGPARGEVPNGAEGRPVR